MGAFIIIIIIAVVVVVVIIIIKLIEGRMFLYGCMIYLAIYLCIYTFFDRLADNYGFFYTFIYSLILITCHYYIAIRIFVTIPLRKRVAHL